MHRAVVLVLEHDAARGTVGLLLDTPANATVSQMLRRRAEPSPHLLPLGGNQLLVGGTVLPRERLRVLTSRCDVPGARRVLPGLYSCAPDAAARMVAIGAADAASFDVYAAACQWSPLQLREELEAALWLPAAASAAAIARPREWRRDGVYFNLVEGLGGQYLKQARRRGCLWARAGGGVPVVAAVGRRLQGGCLRRAVGREGRGLCEVRLGRGARRCCHRELLALRAPCTPPPFPDILGSAPPGAARPHGGGGEVVAGDPLRPSARPAPRPRGGRPLRGGGWRGREEGGWRRARGARGGAATASGDGGRGVVSAPRASLPSLPPGAARGERQLWRLPCQALLYPRDNLTDVRDGVGSLAEQAGGLGLGLGLAGGRPRSPPLRTRLQATPIPLPPTPPPTPRAGGLHLVHARGRGRRLPQRSRSSGGSSSGGRSHPSASLGEGALRAGPAGGAAPARPAPPGRCSSPPRATLGCRFLARRRARSAAARARGPVPLGQPAGAPPRRAERHR